MKEKRGVNYLNNTGLYLDEGMEEFKALQSSSI